MSNLVVLGFAIALVVLVLFWSSRYGGRGRGRGTSLRRSANAHTTATGQAKKGYPHREQAEARARQLSSRDGAPMNVYRCATCNKWHVGHGR